VTVHRHFDFVRSRLTPPGQQTGQRLPRYEWPRLQVFQPLRVAPFALDVVLRVDFGVLWRVVLPGIPIGCRQPAQSSPAASSDRR
jgi:hypothetical protein